MEARPHAVSDRSHRHHRLRPNNPTARNTGHASKHTWASAMARKENPDERIVVAGGPCQPLST